MLDGSLVQKKTNYITALGLACCYGCKAVAELLILKGAEVNYQDNVRLVESSKVMMYSNVILDWFHTTSLGKSKWSLGCGGTVN